MGSICYSLFSISAGSRSSYRSTWAITLQDKANKGNNEVRILIAQGWSTQCLHHLWYCHIDFRICLDWYRKLWRNHCLRYLIWVCWKSSFLSISGVVILRFKARHIVYTNSSAARIYNSHVNCTNTMPYARASAL